jgi:hypothetical protein
MTEKLTKAHSVTYKHVRLLAEAALHALSRAVSDTLCLSVVE